MAKNELQTVLENWIAQANSPIGQLPEGVDPAKWVTSHFTRWWEEHAGEELSNAHSAASRLRVELNRISESIDVGEAQHELTHLQDALSDLEQSLGLNN